MLSNCFQRRNGQKSSRVEQNFNLFNKSTIHSLLFLVTRILSERETLLYAAQTSWAAIGDLLTRSKAGLQSTSKRKQQPLLGTHRQAGKWKHIRWFNFPHGASSFAYFCRLWEVVHISDAVTVCFLLCLCEYKIWEVWFALKERQKCSIIHGFTFEAWIPLFLFARCPAASCYWK